MNHKEQTGLNRLTRKFIDLYDTNDVNAFEDLYKEIEEKYQCVLSFSDYHPIQHPNFNSWQNLWHLSAEELTRLKKRNRKP